MGNREIEKALEEYRDKFGEGFPVYYFVSSGDIGGMLKEIKRAIKTGKPYEPELKEVDGEPVVY